MCQNERYIVEHGVILLEKLNRKCKRNISVRSFVFEKILKMWIARGIKSRVRIKCIKINFIVIQNVSNSRLNILNDL